MELIELFFDHQEDLQKALELLHSVFKRFGLKINIKKTKTMIFNFKYTEKTPDSEYPGTITELENQPNDNVKSF